MGNGSKKSHGSTQSERSPTQHQQTERKEVMKTEESSKNAVDGIELVSVTRSAKRRMPRARIGFEAIAKRFSEAVRADPTLIALKGLDLDQLDADLAASDALVLPIRQVAEQYARMQETLFTHRSSAWAQTLVMYERLRATARTNGQVKYLVQALEALLRVKKTAPADPPATTATTATTTTPTS